MACDAVISTVALPALDRLVPGQTDPYFERARKVEYIGVVCMLLSLNRPFNKYFWTNINDPRISFNGIVEQSALNTNLRDRGVNVLYVPFYLPSAVEHEAALMKGDEHGHKDHQLPPTHHYHDAEVEQAVQRKKVRLQ